MSNKILFVFEGERTEVQITNSLTRYFLEDRTAIQFAFCADIYQLYCQISKDRDLDTFVLLQQRPQNITDLSKYDRSDFAEIYLFFDYEGHATNASDEKIIELLEVFNEETESGKLLLSYPMVEAIKHIADDIDFKNLTVSANQNINYKKLVGEACDNELQKLTTLSLNNWVRIIEIHLKKLNHVVNDNFSLPVSHITPQEIQSNQIKKYIEVTGTIAVLSSFPVFLFDYYGAQRISKKILSD